MDYSIIISMKLLYYQNKGYNKIILLVLFISSLIEGFLGHIPNRGQMSYWGITATINILSVLPFFGSIIAELIWCPSSVIINRIFIFHFLLGILIGLIILLHIFFLHAFSSPNPLLNPMSTMNIPSYPLGYKDFFITFLLILSSLFFLFLEPDILGNCDNHNIASPLTTPHNILPESYFSCFHCWSRSFPNKTIGVIVVLILLISSFPMEF